MQWDTCLLGPGFPRVGRDHTVTPTALITQQNQTPTCTWLQGPLPPHPSPPCSPALPEPGSKCLPSKGLQEGAGAGQASAEGKGVDSFAVEPSAVPCLWSRLTLGQGVKGPRGLRLVKEMSSPPWPLTASWEQAEGFQVS